MGTAPLLTDATAVAGTEPVRIGPTLQGALPPLQATRMVEAVAAGGRLRLGNEPPAPVTRMDDSDVEQRSMTTAAQADAGFRVAADTTATDLDARFAELMRTHRERARRIAWRLVGGDDAAADDVTQDAFLNAYRGLSRFREDAKLETWLFRIVVHQAHTYRRWRAVRSLWNADTDVDAAADPTTTVAGDPLLRRRIAASLERLSRSQRDAFVLVYLEGFTTRAAAAILGKAEGTVKSHLQRALKTLRNELGDLALSEEQE